MIGQAIFESGWGRSNLAVNFNNLLASKELGKGQSKFVHLNEILEIDDMESGLDSKYLRLEVMPFSITAVCWLRSKICGGTCKLASLAGFYGQGQ